MTSSVETMDGEHVVVFIRSLNPGGAEVLALQTCRRWASRGASVRLITTDSTTTSVADARDGVLIEFAELGVLQSVRAARRPMDRLVVHSPSLIAIALFARRSVHCTFVVHGEWSRFGRVRRLIQNLSLARYQNIITVSESTRQQLSRSARKRAHTVAHSIDGATLRERFDPALHDFGHLVRHGEVLFVSIANFRSPKDPESLIRAFAEAKRRGLDARLVMMGDGPLLEQSRNLIQDLNLSDYILTPGRVRHAGAALLRADALILSSRSEGLPVAILEAEACDCPVIASAVGGLVEYSKTHPAVSLVPPGDIGALASSLLEGVPRNSLPQDEDGLPQHTHPSGQVEYW